MLHAQAAPAPAPMPAALPGVDFAPTVLGLPPDGGLIRWSSAVLGPLPGGFVAPQVPNTNFFGLAKGTPLPALLSGNAYYQVSSASVSS
jgi:hypothetical protein